MTDTHWPTEALATKAVEAAARKAHEMSVDKRREVFPPGVVFPEWEELDAVNQLAVREAVLPIVWAALSDLPDPRHGAWAEGYAAGQSDGAFEAGGTGADVIYPHENPYPSGL